MGISHHPPDLLLVEYANGSLPAAPGVIVSAHVARCEACQGAVKVLEEVGGAILEDGPPLALTPGALERALERLDEDETSPALQAEPLRLGPRLTFPGGISIARVRSASTPGWTTMEVSAPAGSAFPVHDHGGPEYACVLEGAFSDGERLFQAGDFAVADANVRRHLLSVARQGPCTALLAIQGPMRWRGPFGLIAPLLGL